MLRYVRRVRSKYPAGHGEPVSEAAGSSAADSADAWRSDPMSLNSTAPYDYLARSHATVARSCFSLALNDPKAGRIIELMVDFIIGDGWAVTFENEAVAEWYENWSTDPSVAIKQCSYEWVADLLTMGEFGLRPEVNEFDGFTRYEPIAISDISNVYKRYSKPVAVDLGGQDGGFLIVAHQPSDPNFARGRGPMVGDLIFKQIKTSTQLTRGYSILMALRDFIEAENQLLFSELSRAITFRKFLLWLKATGADDAKIQSLKAQYSRAPKTGTVLVTNERVEWQFLTPQLHANDAETLIKMVRNMTLAGAGIPEHWLAEGGDANLATATAMGKPTLRRLSRFQAQSFGPIKDAIIYARDQAILHGAIPGVWFDSEGTDPVIVPDAIDSKEENELWTSFTTMMGGIALALTQELMTEGEGRRSVERFLTEMHIELDDLEADADKKFEDKLGRIAAENRKILDEMKSKGEQIPEEN